MLPADPSPNEARVIVPGDEERLIDVATRAMQDEMYVIHNGARVIVCSIISGGLEKARHPGQRPGESSKTPSNPQSGAAFLGCRQ